MILRVMNGNRYGKGGRALFRSVLGSGAVAKKHSAADLGIPKYLFLHGIKMFEVVKASEKQ